MGRPLPLALRSLRHRNYRLFFTGQLVSLTGTWMQSVAQAWLVYRLTGSAVLLGVVGFASQIPVFLLAPVGGAVADRFSRHRILLTTQAVQMGLATLLAVLTLTGRIEVGLIMIIAAGFGLANAFDIPARQAFVVDMVGRDDLVNAIALNSSVFNAARLVGPAVAGVLIAAVGEGWAFALNAASYVGVLTGLAMMRVEPVARVPSAETPVARIVAGFRFVAEARPVRALLLLLGLSSLAGMPYAVLMPVFADQILGGGPHALGLLMGASGAGAFVAAVFLARRTGTQGLGQWVARAAAGFGVSLILFSFSRSLALSVVLLVPVGFGLMTQMAASNTLVQVMVPDALRGRVMAVYSMMFMGMAPIGALLAGALAGVIGAPMTVALGGAVSIAGAGVFAWSLPALRPAARELIVALQPTGGVPSDTSTGGQAADAPRGQLSDEDDEGRSPSSRLVPA